MFLFPIFKWTGDRFPKQQQLDLLTWTELSPIVDKIRGIIPTEKVIHVNVQAMDVKLPNAKPAQKPRYCTPTMG
jgi:hypothetical protein